MNMIFFTLCALILGGCIACCLGWLVYLVIHKLLYLDILLPPLLVLCVSIAMLYMMIF